MTPSLADIARARLDPNAFAELLVGQPLWAHQREVAASPARYRVICAGRQVGKSRLLSVLALHKAFSTPDALVLLVSAGEVAARRLLDDVVALALASPLLAGSIVDESQSLLALSNGSTVRSVPASSRQIRGWAVDLLIVDEAGFVDPEIWRSAEPSIIARPGSRVVLTSSPWGSADHFFRVLWRRGVDAPDAMYAGWHWPSSVSPLVDGGLLSEIEGREEAAYFRREYMAEWMDDSGSYFTEAELSGAVGDFELVDPLEPPPGLGFVVGGVDWGSVIDANTLVVVAGRPVADAVDAAGRPRYWVPYLVEHFRMPYAEWIDRLVGLTARPRPFWSVESAPGFRFSRLVVEVNGVGQMPAQVLAAALVAAGLPALVHPVVTTVRSKETAFGFMKLLLQQDRLLLPNEPALLKQLRALTFEQLPGGGSKITVPERAGHDDLAMALGMALMPLMAADFVPVTSEVVSSDDILAADTDDDGWAEREPSLAGLFWGQW